jgi:hypothetical protein
MKVSGFTFIKDAITYDYPVAESIKSILPLCDELIVAVGKSNDSTLNLIEEINDKKIRIIQTIWDEENRIGGHILAIETNKALAAISKDSDWAFYIQADEVVHEKYFETIKDAMKLYKDDPNVDGLLFNYLHFYGSYDYVGANAKWYPHEIRIIKNNKSIYSYKDAQGFRKGKDLKLNVKAIDAYIYHYGWVKEPKTLQRKRMQFHKYWYDDNWIEENINTGESFNYSEIDALNKFTGTHPAVMFSRIKTRNWKFDHDISKNNLPPKAKIKAALKNYLGINFYHKNYRII